MTHVAIQLQPTQELRVRGTRSGVIPGVVYTFIPNRITMTSSSDSRAGTADRGERADDVNGRMRSSRPNLEPPPQARTFQRPLMLPESLEADGVAEPKLAIVS